MIAALILIAVDVYIFINTGKKNEEPVPVQVAISQDPSEMNGLQGRDNNTIYSLMIYNNTIYGIIIYTNTAYGISI